MSENQYKKYDFSNWSEGEINDLKSQVDSAVKRIRKNKTKSANAEFPKGTRVYGELLYSKTKIFGTVLSANWKSVKVKFDDGKSSIVSARSIHKIPICENSNVITFKQNPEVISRLINESRQRDNNEKNQEYN